ncbi:MAG: MarR family transcriptional regulator [Gaiella sp.]|nr:MarR family transcriptional regulator [Gaiella sp.]
MTERDAVDRITAQWRRERPDLDPAPMGIVGRISRIAALAERELDPVFAEHDLTGADFDVLATLRRSGSPYRLTPGELSRSTMVTTGGMTKRLDRLEAGRLVRREPDPSDRRGKLIALTSRGRDLVDHAVEAHLENEERLLAALPAAKRRQLASLLRELLVSLDR